MALLGNNTGGLGQIANMDDSDYGEELSPNEYNSPEIINGQSDETRPVYFNGERVSPDEIQRADQHLQDVYDGIVARQQELTMRANSGWSPETKMAFFAGMGAPTRTGGFSESFSNAMGSAAPMAARDRSMQESAIDKLNSIKLRAAQLESNRAHQLKKLEIDEELSKQKRMDYLAKSGITIDENGRYILNPDLIKPTKGSKTATPSDGLLDKKNASAVRGQYGAAKTVLPQINWMIDQLEKGKIDNSAFGALAKPAEVYNNTVGQLTGNVAPKDTAFRNTMGLVTEQMKRALSRDGTGKMSNQESDEIAPYLPDDGVFESRDKALIKLRNARSKIIDTTRLRLEDLQDPSLMDEFDQVSTMIAKSNDSVPKKIKAKSDKKVADDKKVNLYPMTVYKDGHMAVVSNEQELNEASQDGWRTK